MLNINGVAKVCKLNEVTGKLISGTLYYGTKNKNGDWDNHFFNAKFVGKAIEGLLTIPIKNKDEINIKTGILTTRTWKDKNGNDRTTTEITVFELEKNVREDKPSDNKDNKSKFNK
jgi:single-stranded DNA-binding protein